MELFLMPIKVNQMEIYINSGKINLKDNQSQILHLLKRKESHKKHSLQKENLILLLIILDSIKLTVYL
jgi:hypothetical protein